MSKLSLKTISLKDITEHPEYICSKRADHYDYCSNCNLYAATVPLDKEFQTVLCRDCYKEIFTPEWKRKQAFLHNEAKKARLKDAFSRECKKRHEKGLAPINLRR